MKTRITFVRTRREVFTVEYDLPDHFSRQDIYEFALPIQNSGELSYKPAEEIDDEWFYLNDEEEPLRNTKKGP